MPRRLQPQLRIESDAHLRLARQFLALVELPIHATEAQVRNTLSRSYYALFLICNAWLVYKKVRRKKRMNHGPLLHSISKHGGPEARERFRVFQRRREDADYKLDVLKTTDFRGDLAGYRAFASTSLQEVRTVIVEYEGWIEKARNEDEAKEKSAVRRERAHGDR